MSLNEAYICGYSDSLGVHSCLPKTTTVSCKVKSLVEDWHLQVQLFSHVETGFFKVFQADSYKCRKPKIYTVTDTVKAKLLYYKRIHGITLSTPGD